MTKFWKKAIVVNTQNVNIPDRYMTLNPIFQISDNIFTVISAQKY